MRKQITIPDAGETLNIGLTGRSFIIENVPVYETPADVPIIAFRPGQNEYPVYPRNTYSNNGELFNELIITGTAESSGDTLDIFVTDECLDTEFNIILSEQYKSVPGTTFTKSASNVVQSLSELELINADGLLPTVVYVSVSPTAGTSGIKWAINANPVQGDDALGTLLSPGDEPVPVKDIAWILAFNFISAVADETPVVNFTPQY